MKYLKLIFSVLFFRGLLGQIPFVIPNEFLYFNDKKTTFLESGFYQDQPKIIKTIQVEENFPILGKVTFNLALYPDKKQAYRFLDENDFERPQDNQIAGNSTFKIQHQGLNYYYFENENKKMPLIPKIPGKYRLQLYDLEFFLNTELNEYKNLSWQDFTATTKNNKFLQLKKEITQNIRAQVEAKEPKRKEIIQKLKAFIEGPERPLCKRNSHGSNDPLINQGTETICLQGRYLITHWDSPYSSMTGNESYGNWGHRGYHFSKFYLMNTNEDYTPVQLHCKAFWTGNWSHDREKQGCTFEWQYVYCKDHGGKNIRIWRSEPLIESENWDLDLKNVFQNRRLMYNDTRSPWILLFYHLEMGEQTVFSKHYWQVDLKDPLKDMKKLKESFQNEKSVHEKGRNNMLKRVELIFKNVEEACKIYSGGDYNTCIHLNTQFNDALVRRVKEKTDGFIAKLQEMIDLIDELGENELTTIAVFPEDFEDLNTLREKAMQKSATDFQYYSIEIAKSEDFQLRPMNNVDIEKNSIIFARESDSKNLLDYLFIPTKTNTAKEIGVKIELKDKENQAIHFEKNTFQFTPSDYGTQAFTGFVEKEFDNGKFQIPLKIQMSRIFFKTADIDVCQNETELLDLSKYLNVPFNPKTMSFTSPDFVILEKNGEKKYINLDQVQPIKDGRVRLLLEDGEIPGSITVKPNIPLPAFDEKPFFVCGQPVLNKRKNKNSVEYVYDLNDLMKGFPANSSFFLDKGNGSFQPIKNGILQTNTDGVQKFQLRSDFTSEWGTCKNNRNIQVELRNSPAQPQITDNILYQELCKGELPTMTFTGWEFKNKLNVYDQKVHYFDPVAVQNFGAQLSDKDFPNTTAIFPKNPTETEHFSLFAYQYDPSTTCLSKPLELKFNPTAFRELPIKSGHPKIQQGEGTVFFVKEDDMKNMENPQFHWTFSNTEFSEVKPIMVAGNFFIQQFLHPGKYHVELHAQFFKKSNPNAQCDLRHTKENFLEVLAIEPTKIPDPILAQTQLKDGNIHVFIDKELVDVYVSLMPMDGQVGYENTFNGYFEFFKDWDYKVRKGIPYMLTIYKGKKPDLNKIIFKLKILSLDGVYTETFKAQHNINPNSEF